MDINYSQNFFKPHFFNKCLGEKEISKIINLTNPLPFTKGTTKNPNKNIHRDSDIKWIDPNQSTQWLFDELTNLVNYANKNFWGFDIINYNSSTGRQQTITDRYHRETFFISVYLRNIVKI
jgi:hypothetical protein